MVVVNVDEGPCRMLVICAGFAVGWVGASRMSSLYFGFKLVKVECEFEVKVWRGRDQVQVRVCIKRKTRAHRAWINV